MKKMLTLVLALMMALTMIGAASADEVLTVVTWDATTTPYLVAQEAAFEAANPGVDLQYIDVASQDYAIKVGTMLSGGDTSDVVMIKEARDIINWQAAGYAAPMSDYIAADNFDLAGMSAPKSTTLWTACSMRFRSALTSGFCSTTRICSTPPALPIRPTT